MQDYTLNDKGERVYTDKKAQIMRYNMLLPYSANLEKEFLNKSSIIEKQLKELDLSKPVILTCKELIPNIVFSILLFRCLAENNGNYLSHKRISLQEIFNLDMTPGIGSATAQFNQYQVLFITANLVEQRRRVWGEYMKLICNERKLLGLKTFIFFWGERSLLNDDIWMINEAKDPTDERMRKPVNISKYVNVRSIDL